MISFIRRGIVLLAATLGLGLTAAAIAASTEPFKPDEWRHYGRTYSEDRFVPADQIRDSNIARLGVEWSLDLPEETGLIATPLMVDGRIFFNTGRSNVHAVDATTGKLLWTWHPDIGEKNGKYQRFSAVHGGRGVAYWKGKVITATSDGRLVGIDANSGKEVWSNRVWDAGRPLYMSGSPKVFDGRVVVGNAGSEIGFNRGYVSSFDAETGKELWRFNVVPGNPKDGFESKAMEMAAKTWTGEWWKFGGGGNVWAEGFAYDPELNTVYIGTGNGTPWNRKIRSPKGGDNLFIASIVALDAATGEYKWHYQQTPGDQWDFDSTSQLIVTDLNLNGRVVKALLHAPKNGYFYVLDRTNGKLVSVKSYAKVTWSKGIDLKTGRPIENPAAEYNDAKGPVEVWPTDWGAHSWQPISYSPKTGLVYIPTINEGITYSVKGVDYDLFKKPFKYDDKRHWVTGVEILDGKPGQGTLQAWDPIKQKRMWEVKVPGVWSPGTLATGGNLVFQGNVEGDFVAYNATTGQELWRRAMGLGIASTPISYSLNGKQYVALLVGWGSGWAGLRGEEVAKLGWAYRLQTRRLVVFALDGKTKLEPLAPPSPAKPLVAQDFKVNAGLAAKGEKLYVNCDMCHGPAAVSGGIAPDLRASPMVPSDPAFRSAMRDGLMTARGMPKFSDFTDEQISALQHYIRQQSDRAIARSLSGPSASSGR